VRSKLEYLADIFLAKRKESIGAELRVEFCAINWEGMRVEGVEDFGIVILSEFDQFQCRIVGGGEKDVAAHRRDRSDGCLAVGFEGTEDFALKIVKMEIAILATRDDGLRDVRSQEIDIPRGGECRDGIIKRSSIPDFDVILDGSGEKMIRSRNPRKRRN